MSVPFDLNATPGAITTALGFTAPQLLVNIVGQQIFRITSPSGRFSPLSATFTVTNAALPQSIDGVISTLGNKKLDRPTRRAEVVKLIRAKFDFEVMGRFILGTYWKNLSPADRAAFVERFGQILENTYMNRIESYTDEKVKYLEENGLPVFTDIRSALKALDVFVDWHMQRR